MAIDILQAFEETPPLLDFVLPGLLAGTVGAIVSPGGAGKSMLALELSMLVATGHDLSGFIADVEGNIGKVEYLTGKVVFLAAEDPAGAISHRLHAIGKHLSADLRAEVAINLLIEPLLGHQPDLMNPKWVQAIERVATGKRLLILDTLRRFHLLDENDSGQMAMLLSVLEGIAKRTGCTILFLHHASKAAAMNGQGDMQQASRGSSVLVDNIRWQMFLSGCTKEESKGFQIQEERRGFFVRVGVSKQNYGPPVQEIWMERKEGGVLAPAHLETSSVATKKGGRREKI